MFNTVFSLFKALVAVVLFVFCVLMVSLLILVAGALRSDKLKAIIGDLWADMCAFILYLTTRIEWDIQGFENINPQKSYLIIANHQSYIDIPVLYKVITRKVALTRFFMKKQFKYVPIWGWACRILDFPFMHRYSKETLAKHPELKGKDIEATRRTCAKLRGMPFSLVNFAEGTRYTESKHKEKKSPFKYLLPPKTGGIAYSLAIVGDTLESILNVTLVYVGGEVSVWNFFTGKIKKVVVQAEILPVTKEILGDYEEDLAFRQHMQSWVNDLWKRKDHFMDEILSSSETKCLQ